MKDKLGLKGRGRLTVTDPRTGKVVKVIKFKNIVVTVGRQFVGDMLIDRDIGHDTGLIRCAIGTSPTTPLLTDTSLSAEANRKLITTRSRVGTEIFLSTFFTAAESAFNVREAGIFGHATATATASSGIMFSRWLVAFDNSAGLFDLTFDYVLTI